MYPTAKDLQFPAISNVPEKRHDLSIHGIPCLLTNLPGNETKITITFPSPIWRSETWKFAFPIRKTLTFKMELAVWHNKVKYWSEGQDAYRFWKSPYQDKLFQLRKSWKPGPNNLSNEVTFRAASLFRSSSSCTAGTHCCPGNKVLGKPKVVSNIPEADPRRDTCLFFYLAWIKNDYIYLSQRTPYLNNLMSLRCRKKKRSKI